MTSTVSTTTTPRRTKMNQNGKLSIFGVALLMLVVVLSMTMTTVLVSALHEDEIGLFDLAIQTTGHGGPIDYLEVIKNTNDDQSLLMITSDSGPTIDMSSSSSLSSKTRIETSCYVACRLVATGSILWRRNVCSMALSSLSSGTHITLVTTNQLSVITVDIVSGIVRSWSIESGSLQWETDIKSYGIITTSTNVITLWNVNDSAVAINTILTIDIMSGSVLSSSTNGKPQPPVPVGGIIIDTPYPQHTILCPVIATSAVDASDTDLVAAITAILDYPTTTKDRTRKTNNIYWYPQRIKFNYSIILNKDSKKHLEDGTLLDSWTGVDVLSVDSTDYVHSVNLVPGGTVTTTTSTTGSTIRSFSFHVIITTYRGVTTLYNVLVTQDGTNEISQQTNIVWSTEESLGRIVPSTSALILDASHYDSIVATAAAATGDSTSNPDSVSDVSDGTILVTKDHPSLQFTKRLDVQIQSIVNFPDGVRNFFALQKKDNHHHRDSRFGLDKVIIFITSTKLIAIDTKKKTTTPTNSNDDYRIRYSIDLKTTLYATPPKSYTHQYQHKLIHGSINSNIATHGINGGARTRDVIVISYPTGTTNADTIPGTYETDNNAYDYEVKFTCFDGTRGTILKVGTIPYSLTQQRKIIQIIPIASTSSSDTTTTTTTSSSSICQQNALLVFDDYTILSLLEPSQSEQIIDKYTANSVLYSHYIDAAKSKLTSLAVLPVDGSIIQATPVGSTSFPGEAVVQVVYPNREEVIQSPCNILGDESLLLKYINPHMMVIVTTTKEKDDETTSNSSHHRIASAIREATNNQGNTNDYNTKKTISKQKRKPLGVTTDSIDESDDANLEAAKRRLQQSDQPNLFINIVDTVSGRILYRIGHSNAVIAAGTGTTPVNVLISENWIYYTYFNERTRRTELGVLSLYEGMIDPKGLSAFSSPITSTKFSSLDSIESTPVVLAKVYTLPKSVTSLGITSSRGGISVKRLLVATGDGQIYQVDRKVLEPRRPVGPLKDSEKKEGLIQYNEFVPLVPLMAVTYNLTIHDIRTVLTAPTDLESQTIVVAYGGPDIYITRISPSRGFDLLPDSFNKLLLSFVVILLIGSVIVTHQMGTKKIVKLGWV